MKLYKVGPTALADAIGINKSGMAAFLSGKYNLKQNQIESVFKVLGIEFVIKQPTAQRLRNKWDTVWSNMFISVKSYHVNSGVWPSPKSSDKEIKKLGWWCVTQRQFLKKGKLSNTRKQMLDAIEFDWGIVYRDRWTEKFEALKKYRSNTGKWPYAKSDNKDEAKLGRWLSEQRAIAKGKKTYKMLPERLKKLEAIDFWKPDYRGRKETAQISSEKKTENLKSEKQVKGGKYAALWYKTYADVEKYKKATGKWPTSTSKNADAAKLGVWCNRQRQCLKKGLLSPERQAKLNEIGFGEPSHSASWETKCSAVKEYRDSTGKWPSASSKDAEISELGRWISTQKLSMSKGYLSQERQAKLNKIGFDWNPRYLSWDSTYMSVKKYKKNTGKWPKRTLKNADAAKLGVWCDHQRRYLKTGLLSQERQAKLNEIGFEWVTRCPTSWDEKCSAVKEYRDSTDKWPSASSKDAKISELGRWCAVQRQFMKKGRLNSERQAKLNEISFDWALHKGR